MHTQKSATQRGVTLIELLVTIAVLGTLLGVGVPLFTDFVRNNQMDAVTTRLVGTLNFARSEASNRATVITLARKSINNNDWSQGWEVYTDDDATGNTARVGGDTLLRDVDMDSGDITVLSNAPGEPWISYRDNGMLLEDGNDVLIAICDERGEADGREVTVGLTGRVTLTTPANNCAP